MKNSNSYKKLYIISTILLIIFLLSFFIGFALFAIKILDYNLSTAIICSLVVNIIIFKDFAKLSVLIVIHFMDIDLTEDILDNKVIKIKDYLRKKGRIK